MKYDLSKLNKEDYLTIIKSLPPKFSGLGYFPSSHHNKVSDNLVELYDDKSNLLFDMWGRFEKDKNRALIKASDIHDFFSVDVYLYEDHFEIPEYENENSNFYFIKTDLHIQNYVNLLDDIFAKKLCNLRCEEHEQTK